MPECIFCKIAAREIPAEIVYEDDRTIAFLDIKPVNHGHTLVIPKAHSSGILDITEDAWASLTNTAQKIARSIETAIAPEGMNLIMNNKPAGGQVIFHSHIHVIPRYEGDNFFKHPPVRPYQEGEAAATGRKIRGALL